METVRYNFEKKCIGYLLKYYRKKRNIKIDDLLTKKGTYYYEYCTDCVKCKNKELVCSTKKLYSLERGEVSKNDCYYYRLAENLDKKFVIDRRLDNKRLNYQTSLVENIVNLSKRNLKRLAALLENDLHEYSEVLYYGDIFSLYLDVINYYLYQKIPSVESIQLYLYLLEFIDDTNKKIALTFLYEISYRVSSDVIDRSKIRECCKPYQDDALFFKFKLEQIVSQNYLDAFEQISQLEEKMGNNLTDYQKCLLLEYKAFILMNADANEKSYNTMKQCLSVAVNNQGFSDYIVNSYYGKLGIVCFVVEKYDEVVECFNELVVKGAPIGPNYSLLFYSMSKCGLEHKIVDVMQMVDKEYLRKPFVEKIFNYYSMKYTQKEFSKKDYILLENMICFDIKPYLDMHGSLQKTIFTDELKFCVEKTGNYKKYYNFQEN